MHTRSFCGNKRVKHILVDLIDPAHHSLRFYNLDNHYSGKTEHYGIKPSLDVESPLIV